MLLLWLLLLLLLTKVRFLFAQPGPFQGPRVLQLHLMSSYFFIFMIVIIINITNISIIES